MKLLSLLKSRPAPTPEPAPETPRDYREVLARRTRLDPETKRPVWPITGVPS